MRIVRGIESYPPDGGPSAVALGVFDGVHLGHRSILARAVSRARAGGLVAVACTFEPHPAEILQPERAPLPITTLEERLERIAATGIDATLVLAFTLGLAAMEPEAFAREVLAGRLRAREVVVGENHRFGRGARGDARLLEELGREFGFRAHVVPPLTVDGIAVSSTEIRGALQRGDVTRAARLLGRPYTVRGLVVRGAGRGRNLGFPTANIASHRPVMVAAGVYVCEVDVGSAIHPAVVNVGVRPTFGETNFAIEAHLIDFVGDLYGQPLEVRFLRRLRDERKFPSIEDLKFQIGRDVAAARRPD